MKRAEMRCCNYWLSAQMKTLQLKQHCPSCWSWPSGSIQGRRLLQKVFVFLASKRVMPHRIWPSYSTALWNTKSSYQTLVWTELWHHRNSCFLYARTHPAVPMVCRVPRRADSGGEAGQQFIGDHVVVERRKLCISSLRRNFEIQSCHWERIKL